MQVTPAKFLRTAFGIRGLSSAYISRVFLRTEMALKSRSVLTGSKSLARSRSTDNLPTSQSQVNIQMMSHTLTIREVCYPYSSYFKDGVKHLITWFEVFSNKVWTHVHAKSLFHSIWLFILLINSYGVYSVNSVVVDIIQHVNDIDLPLIFEVWNYIHKAMYIYVSPLLLLLLFFIIKCCECFLICEKCCRFQRFSIN